MPLHDHFHPPLSSRRHWHSFHNAWATRLAAGLNSILPERYFAEPNVQLEIEIDVATFEEGTAAAAENSLCPAPTRTIPFPRVADSFEVSVYGDEGGPTLVGAVELVSPANKDRREHREAFVSKCETYLQAGVGLVVVDVVTSRSANLHADLLRRLGSEPESSAELYAVSYRPVKRGTASQLELWEASVTVGSDLPVLPFWLSGLLIQLDLEGSYAQTCRDLRLGTAAS